jgi:catechol 2,3-dioxygenase-like lactoylglutathione lyase family enzyme
MVTMAHVGIYVGDLVRSVVFYGETLGFQVSHTMETSTSKIAFLDAGALGDGSRIAFFKDPDGHDVEIMER